MTVIRVDLNCEELLRKVDNEQDRVLLKEAVLALDGGALRAAYVMTWIACAESIKRRLRECANWDKEAESILTQIKGLENNQKAIDGKLVDFAKAVGVVDDIEGGQLSTIYQNRNIYNREGTVPAEFDSSQASSPASSLARLRQRSTGTSPTDAILSRL